MAERTTIDLLQGTLGVLILKSLSWGPMHGYGIARWIEQIATQDLLIEEGSLYPALHRLEKQGWLDSEWKLTENKQRAKYCRLTATGRRQLQTERTRWTRFSKAIARVLGGRSPLTVHR